MRILAILFVIICHASETIIFNYQEYNKLIFSLLHNIGRLGVPIFFMISGYLLFSKTYDNKKTKRFYTHNLLTLILCWEIWILIYNVFFVINGQSFVGYKNLLKE